MMRIVKHKTWALNGNKSIVNRLIEHPCGYGALTDFGRDLLWWAWLREESQYGDIIHRPWGPVSRVPIPESIWGVYDVLPPPAGSNAALLLDHHNKFRTT